MLFHSFFQNIAIKGISVAVPTERVPVSSFNDAFGEEVVSKFSKMTAVKSFHRAKPEQTASDLGFEAAKDLREKGGFDPQDIGILVFVTQKPDYRVPSTAFVLHKRLQLREDCVCFDLNLACSGFIYGLQTVCSMLQSSDVGSALLITGDTSHRTLSPEDRTMIMLFGDSGSATLLTKSEGATPIHIALRTDGGRFKSIITPAGAYRNQDAPKERQPWGDGIKRSDYDTHMKGMDVFGFSITDVPGLMKEFMDLLGTSPEQYDCFALHQANMYILKQLSRKLKIPKEKIPVALDRFGNNSSNSIPLVLSDTYGTAPGQVSRVFMSGFGAGLSWGCGDVSLHTDHIHPIVYTDAHYGEYIGSGD